MRTLIIAMILVGCGSPNRTAQPAPDWIKDTKARYVEFVGTHQAEVFTKRCDKLTFLALFSAYGAPQDLSGFQYPVAGKWNRDNDPANPCYPAESKSEISPDPYIMLAHHWLLTKNTQELTSSIDYAEQHNYRVGEGPWELTNVALLIPLLRGIQDNLSLLDDDPSIIEQQLQGFRGHLLAFYIHAASLTEGHISWYWKPVLTKLVTESSDSPLILAIASRWLVGSYREQAISLLTRDYKGDTISLEDGVYGWGSLPSAVALVVTAGLLE